MWPYAASSLKRLLIEDHKRHAYVRLYIQELFGEAQLSKFLTTKITWITELHKLYFRSVLANDLCRYVVAVDQYTPGFLDISFAF